MAALSCTESIELHLPSSILGAYRPQPHFAQEPHVVREQSEQEADRRQSQADAR